MTRTTVSNTVATPGRHHSPPELLNNNSVTTIGISPGVAMNILGPGVVNEVTNVTSDYPIDPVDSKTVNGHVRVHFPVAAGTTGLTSSACASRCALSKVEEEES